MNAPATGVPEESTTRPLIDAFPPPSGRVVDVGLPSTAIGSSDTAVRLIGSVVVVLSSGRGGGRALPSSFEQEASSGSSSTRPLNPRVARRLMGAPEGQSPWPALRPHSTGP
jgi:hypothetical protein